MPYFRLIIGGTSPSTASKVENQIFNHMSRFFGSLQEKFHIMVDILTFKVHCHSYFSCLLERECIIFWLIYLDSEPLHSTCKLYFEKCEYAATPSCASRASPGLQLCACTPSLNWQLYFQFIFHLLLYSNVFSWSPVMCLHS